MFQLNIALKADVMLIVGHLFTRRGTICKMNTIYMNISPARRTFMKGPGLGLKSFQNSPLGFFEKFIIVMDQQGGVANRNINLLPRPVRETPQYS